MISSNSREDVLQLQVRTLALVTVFLPLIGFILCIFCAFVWHFEKSTYTHCEVFNFAPSISAAIGSPPQNHLWQALIAIHSAPRFLFAALGTLNIKQKIELTSFRLFLIRMAFILQVSEILALLTLSLITSKENFPTHKTAFATFLLCALINMTIVIFLISKKCGYTTQNQFERKAVIIRQRLYKLTLFFGICMLLLYWRHNEYCEPLVYSYFCISEYIIVLANMGFHLTAFYDFYHSTISISKSGNFGFKPLENVDSA